MIVTRVKKKTPSIRKSLKGAFSVGSNYRIQVYLFPFHQLTKSSLVISLFLQSLPTKWTPNTSFIKFFQLQKMQLVFLSAWGYDNDLSIVQKRWIKAYLDFQNFDQKLQTWTYDCYWPLLLKKKNQNIISFTDCGSYKRRVKAKKLII